MHRGAPASILIGSLLLAGAFNIPPAHAAGLADLPIVGGPLAAIEHFLTNLFAPKPNSSPQSNGALQTPTSSSPTQSASHASAGPAISAAPTDNTYVTQAALGRDLAGLTVSLKRSLLGAVGNIGPAHEPDTIQHGVSITSAAGSFGSASINDLTVNGVTGLKTSDIPDLSGTYLSTSGGTVSGNLTVTGSFSGGALSLANASTTLLSVTGPAYFGSTATSMFAADGSLTLAKALGVASGGTGWTNINAGSIVFGNGASALATSTNLFWDNTNSRLGIGTATPTYALDVSGYINADQYSGYKQAGNNVLVASSTFHSLFVGTLSAVPPLTTSTTGAGSDCTGSNIAGLYNVGIGEQALSSLTNGCHDVAIGYEAMQFATSSELDTAVGSQALQYTRDAGTGENSAFGYNALGQNTYGYHNTALGSASMQFSTTGTGNTGVGSHALYSNITGTNNVGVGWTANKLNTIGSQITAVGTTALFNNQGSYNTAVGYSALNANLTGANNTAVGALALLYNNSATTSVAVGYEAGQGNSAGYSNQGGTYVGYAAGQSLQTGSDFNTLIGMQSGLSLTTGTNNTATGYNSLNGNITGIGNVAVGSFSAFFNKSATSTVAIGYGAAQGTSNYSAQGGTYLGYNAGSHVSTGSDYNTILGFQGGLLLTSGANNILIGASTISPSYGQVTTGSNNIAIGTNVALPSATASNQLDIQNIIYGTGNTGTGATVSTGNIGIGTTTPDVLLTVGSATPSGNVAHFENSTGSCYINPTTTSLSCSSDARLKKNIAGLDASSTLAGVLALQPVSYNWNSEATAIPPHTGFIAQAVQQIFPDLVSQGPDGYYTLNYAGFAPYLTGAIQQIAHISGAFKTNLVAWLGSASNGINDFFAAHIHSQEDDTQKLCVSDVCVTRDQFLQMVQASGEAATIVPSGQGSAPTQSDATTSPATPDTSTNATSTPSDPTASSITPDQSPSDTSGQGSATTDASSSPTS